MNLLKVKFSYTKINPKNIFPYIFCSLLVIFCNFWIFHAKPCAPLYYFYLLALLNIFILLSLKKVFSLSNSQKYSIICSLYTLLTMVITATEWQYTIHMVTAISCFVIVTLYMKYLNKNQVLTMTNLMFCFNSILISIETFWRISHPTLSRLEESIPDDSTFYIFKINSFMYSDSNGIALMTITFIFLAYYLYKNVSPNRLYILFIILFTFLTILTFSRAAWIAMIMTFTIIASKNFLKKHLYFYIVKNKTTLKLLLFILFIPTTIFFSLCYVFYLLFQDASFATKLHLLNCVKTFFCDTSLYQIIFGIGSSLEISSRLFERYPHNIILIYLTWVGIIGTLLVTYFWWNIYKETNKKSWLIFVPHFMAGISYTIPGLHLFYISLAIIYYFEKILPKQIRRSNAISINCNDNI